MSQDFAAIWQEAQAAARWAVSADNPDAPREQPQALDCGYAWVVFCDGRHPFVRWCRKGGHGDKHWRKGWNFECSHYHRGQSVSVHYAAAKALSDVLSKHFPDVTVYPSSRLD